MARKQRLRNTLLKCCLLFYLLLFSCAPKSAHYIQINHFIGTNDYQAALKYITHIKGAYSSHNASLFHLEAGILAHYALMYHRSNQDLTKAEAIMDALYTRSISRKAASFILNDLTLAYHGEDFENVVANLFMALNYACQGLREDALVEARKVDNKLNIINKRYAEGSQNIYREDAFVRFLMGILYEAGGELNDAFISYRKAEEIYRKEYEPIYRVTAPPFLIENLLTASQALGFSAEAEAIQKKYPGIRSLKPDQKEKMAEILIIHYNGLGPEKVERNWHIPMLDGYIIKIAYPAFVDRHYRIGYAKTFLSHRDSGKKHRFDNYLVEDIGAIAKLNLENRMGRIKIKAIARATSKYLMTKTLARVARKESGELAGVLVQMTGNLASIATEQADLRQWRLLPDDIRVGRALVAPGHYNGRIDFFDSKGGVVFSKAIDNFQVKGGEKKFLIYRTIS